MKNDIEIAQEAQMHPILDIADQLGIETDEIELYGNYKAKINRKLNVTKQAGKLILVTAITPTPAGEGKTTVSIGLGDGLRQVGKKSMIVIREPSMGPVFGVKGGAAGGGYAQVVPMEDINLHFTGDFHAIGAANNLLAALIDNHIQQGNELQIDPRRITWKRCVDMNDRQLRQIVDGLGSTINGVPREDGFEITVASEVMAILCLSNNLEELKQNFANILVAYTYDNEPIYASQLHAQGAMTVILKDAIKPNLVQTLEHTPVLIHGGPFANIAHGCNSIIATKLGLQLGEYVVTEAGFGSDLGAEKFLDIKCRKGNIAPSAVVIVATVRALKMHGGVAKPDLTSENLEALKSGLSNLWKHVENMQNVYGLSAVVAINCFPTDTESELMLLEDACAEKGIQAVRCEAWAKGGAGAKALAEAVVKVAEANQNPQVHFSYDENDSIVEKIEAVVQKIYDGNDVQFEPMALRTIKRLEELGYAKLPICIAKTQYSFSDDPKKIGRPTDFSFHVSNVKVSAGAGFIVVYAGNIMTMPGLPRVPAANHIDIDMDGKITGLF